MDRNELYTYCILCEDKSNIKALLGHQETENWKKLFKGDFYKSYLDFGAEKLDVQRYYCDPDQTYLKPYDHVFFCDMVKFLTKQEERFQKKSSTEMQLQGKFAYDFVEGKGIRVSGTDKDDNKITPFYLRSDQLGFSAPSNEKSHPYDLFIMKSEDKHAALDQVMEWIAVSRTIGGSFLWPRPFYDNYNKMRGGKFTSKKQFYIQDRVDLTLWEVYYWYNKPQKNTILKGLNTDNPNLDIWLNHFNNFETYADFFCFTEYLVQGDKPVNIFDGGTAEPQWDTGDKKMEINREIEFSRLKKMLDRVVNGIEHRSIYMQSIVSGNPCT